MVKLMHLANNIHVCSALKIYIYIFMAVLAHFGSIKPMANYKCT